MPPPNTVSILSPEEIAASSKSGGKQSLQNLQSKMKCDPECYESELELIYKQFNSSLELFRQQTALSFNSLSGIGSDPTVVKDLGERAMFLAHMTQFYPNHLSVFPIQLADLLRTTAKSLPSSLRQSIVKALILLTNRNNIAISETLPLFMELQTLDDKVVRKLAYSHVVCFIQRMNKKRKDELKNKPLQNVLFQMLQCEDEQIAKRSLVTLCDLHSRKVWLDDRTVNYICSACFHPSSRIMIAALSFLLDYEKIKDDDIDDSSSEDEASTPLAHVVLSKEDVYKAHHKGTTSSKKKKKAKLQRVMRSLKKKQRLTSEKTSPNYHTPLTKLKDAQGFAEKLFSRLQSCNERFEVKMIMMRVIARTIWLHQLILLKFYPYLLKFVQPHQRDVTKLLAAAVQACHDMVPADAVQPLFDQVVDQFVHDRSRAEAITIGLNVAREMCIRMPLLMTDDLLQDLVKYKTSKEKAVSSAARSLITLFRELCPSLLVKKDRGQPTNPKAMPKAYGEVSVASSVPGAELLQQPEEDVDVASDLESDGLSNIKEINSDDAAALANVSDGYSMAYSGSKDDSTFEDSEGAKDVDEDGEFSDVELEDEEELYNGSDSDDDDEEEDEDEDEDTESDPKREARKRKFANFDEQMDAANTNLRALKKLTTSKLDRSGEAVDHIYSNEDFQRIKELQAKESAKTALTRHGLVKGSCSKSVAIKIPSSDQLSLKPVDPSTLEAHIRRKMTKKQRVALIKAGRDDRREYKSKTAVKQKKKGGSSNREKERKKLMPLVAKRFKVAKSKIDSKRKKSIATKQFRGKKAWK